MVEKLHDRNRSHFGQAQGTPFTVPPLSEDLNFDGATSSTEIILDGTYDSSGLANITRLVISNLRESKYVIRAPLTTTISDAAYVFKIKNWKESTSTSPSARPASWSLSRHGSPTRLQRTQRFELDSKQSGI
jgi:hypothetical protein